MRRRCSCSRPLRSASEHALKRDGPLDEPNVRLWWPRCGFQQPAAARSVLVQCPQLLCIIGRISVCTHRRGSNRIRCQHAHTIAGRCCISERESEGQAESGLR
jgi:hypothetical protein